MDYLAVPLPALLATAVVLRQFQADARVEVAPGARFCCHVIGERAIELVDDADFSFASCVAVALHLHFHVV